MIAHPLPPWRLVLASASPRRRHLLQGLDLHVDITQVDVDETPPEGLPADEVAEFLARKKAMAWAGNLAKDQVLITADTTVLLGDQLLNKPDDTADAHRMLGLLSGNTHRVITGVCVRTADGIRSFSDVSEVTFRTLSEAEIAYYVETCAPFDKAGSYGYRTGSDTPASPGSKAASIRSWAYRCTACTKPFRNSPFRRPQVHRAPSAQQHDVPNFGALCSLRIEEGDAPRVDALRHILSCSTLHSGPPWTRSRLPSGRRCSVRTASEQSTDV